MSGHIPSRISAYIGIMVSSTAYKNQSVFDVFCGELTPHKTGDIGTHVFKMDLHVKNLIASFNKQGQQVADKDSEIYVTTNLKASYLGFDKSRSIPTVTRGQMVLVLNYGNTDEYFWTPLSFDPDKRTFEHIRWSCSNSGVINKEVQNIPRSKQGINRRQKDIDKTIPLAVEDWEKIQDDYTYYVEIDTKYGKTIHAHTSCSDGEKWGYDIKIDARKEIIEVYDTPTDSKQFSNKITLESQTNPDVRNSGRITLENNSGTTMVLDGKHLFLDVQGDMIVNIKGKRIINIDGDDSLTADSRTEVIDKLLAIKAGEINYQAPKMAVVADTQFGIATNSLICNANKFTQTSETITVTASKSTLAYGEVTISGSGSISSSIDRPHSH